MPIDEAILYFCEECHTVSLQGGVCANCENPLQVDFFVPKSELEALRSALAERKARIAQLETAFASACDYIDQSPCDWDITPTQKVKYLIFKDIRENLQKATP